MSVKALCLGDLARSRDWDNVQAFCSRCGAPLGRYSAGLRFPERDIVVISEPGATTRVLDARRMPRGSIDRGIGVRGPRTQPGLYEERFGGQTYLRKRCSCRANDKRRLEDLGDLPVTIRTDDGAIVLVF